ncbi:MAG: YtxH domain-containing protein [Chitinophagales bacterium]|nr:YtxH domain-containing protein [Chitinophagales bacterium]MBP8753670.1 YtxH domain-containing protein [Chitinophagales bacterium]MBP9189180.1 YtxH domain-containing protein [Chitinophagales bacterium]MBP9703853.1 YtxH domain-containing protein [Chitinophagales bacterium]
MSSGKTVLGLLAGLAAGAALGILFAPEKGTKTRKRISKKGKDIADDFKSELDDLLCSVKESFQNTKTEIETMFEKEKNQLSIAAKELKNVHDK